LTLVEGMMLGHIVGRRASNFFGAAFLALVVAGAPPAIGSSWPTPENPPEKVRVIKSQRILEVWRDGAVIRSFRVSLGANPLGHKQQEGDGRTPEGTYFLNWRKRDSVAYRSIHVSYPNEEDLQRAREAGVKAGGSIMIHGQWNGYGMVGWVLQNFDWTNGCIGLDNADMDELWDMLAWNTPIEIVP
jgi:murein L,D-transpeptidase YafK